MMRTPVREEVVRMHTSVASFEEMEAQACDAITSFVGSVRVDALSAPDAARVLRAAAHWRNQLDAVVALVANRAAAAPEFRGTDGGKGAAERIGRATGQSTAAAKRVLATGAIAVAHPALEDAMRAGELSGPQAERIADAA